MARVINFLKRATGIGASQEHHPYKMLLIGETGSGKTSFLNLLCNCGTIQALGGKFNTNGIEQFRQFNDVQLENAESHKMESKTSGVKLYNCELGELKIGIIDTPGFGDSRGMKQDKEHVKKIIAALEGEEFVNCVCLIINGRQARMSVTLKYVMSEITAILPREILDNIFVVFSNTSDVLDLNFDPGELQQFFGQPIKHFFPIENPYCRFEKAKQKQKQLPLDMIARSLQKAFEDTAEVLNDMYDIMKELKQVHTVRFVTLFEKKQEIERSVIELLTAYDNQKRLEKAIKNAQEEVDAAFRTKDLKKGYKCMRSVKIAKVVSTSRHNTLCGYKECYSNCHEPCYLDKSFDKEVFKDCASHGGNSYCKKCGHHYTHHYHNEVKFVIVTENKDYIDEDLKKQFDAAKSQEERARILKGKLKKKLTDSEAERERLSATLLSVMEEFHSLGVNRSYAKLIENQLRAIETHIEGATGDEAADLIKTKEELEKKLKIVKRALKSA